MKFARDFFEVKIIDVPREIADPIAPVAYLSTEVMGKAQLYFCWSLVPWRGNDQRTFMLANTVF